MGTKSALRAALRALALLALARTARADGLPAPATEIVFGQKMVYYEAGAGPTVILLHGLATSAPEDWGACIGPMASHHHVVAPDQLGFGASDKPMIDYGIQTWVDMLGEFIREKGLRDFTLVGESLGGWIALQYTVQSSGRDQTSAPGPGLVAPRRLVLVDAAGHRRLAEALTSGGSSAASLALSRQILSSIFHDPSRASDAATRAKFTKVLGKGDGWTIRSLTSNRGLVGEAVDDRLGSVTVPTLVIWGRDDRLIPLDDGRDFTQRIHGARLVIITQSGHAPAIEQTGAFLAAVLPFIDQP